MLQSKKISVYRFNHELPQHLPLAVRSTGAYALVAGALSEEPIRKWFAEVFWCESGRGEFDLDGQQIQVKERDIFYLLPGELHSLRPLSKVWKYHWLTLDHTECSQWLKAFGFDKRPIQGSPCPIELFKNLREALARGTVSGDREAAHQAHAILLAATEGALPATLSRDISRIEQCRKNIDEKYADPQLSVEGMAAAMGMHRATLFRAFKQVYQMTPSHYLQSRRIHQAIELLKQTDLPVKEVAYQVGITDANYFARLIQKFSGVSPRSFREGYRHGRSAFS